MVHELYKKILHCKKCHNELEVKQQRLYDKSQKNLLENEDSYTVFIPSSFKGLLTIREK